MSLIAQKLECFVLDCDLAGSPLFKKVKLEIISYNLKEWKSLKGQR